MSLRTLAQNLALSLGSLAALLLLLEAGLRLAEPAPLRPTSLSDYSEYDPVLGWRKRPGVRLQFTRQEYSVPFETNSLGLRDPERGHEAAPGVERVLALGDSYVEGYTVALEDTLTQRLERALRQRGCRAEVINGATTGYSTDQEYLFYLHEGVRYAPRVVLLFFYANDVFFNDASRYYESASKPVFVFRQGRLEVWKQPVPAPPPPRPLPEPSDEAAPSLRVLEWVKERLWFGAPRLYNRLGRLGLWEANRPIGARLEQRVHSRAVNPQLEGGWEKTEAILAKLTADVREAGRRLLVVYVPARFEINDRAWTLTAERYDIRDPTGWDRDLVRSRLLGIAGRVRFPVLDLSPALRAADQGLFGSPYFERDGHWSARGHEIAAREVFGYLSATDWLASCPPPRTADAEKGR